MTKSNVITERMDLSTVVQTGIGSKTIMERIVGTKSVRRESLGIIVVLQGIMVKIIRSRGTIG